MLTKMFVNLPVRDLTRSEAFFTDLGFEFFGMTDDMASVSRLIFGRPRGSDRQRRSDRQRGVIHAGRMALNQLRPIT